jgi:signal transduction histidine kinase/DNA-binding response OmpR family regulator/HPt (histidine-containing phosphotransfer) domain-containing protein
MQIILNKNNIPILLITIFLIILASYNFLAFHVLSELIIIVISFCLLIIALNAYSISKNSYFTLIAIALGFMGVVELVHLLAYKGMTIFPEYGSNLATQTWVIARYIESISILIAFLFLKKYELNTTIALTIYSLITVVLLWMVFNQVIFPVCYIEGVGLTPFKIVSEYLISLFFLAAIGLTYHYRKSFKRDVYIYMILFLGFSIISEMLFILYVDVYSSFNLYGHIFKIFAVWFLYKAIIQKSVKKPFETLFREMNNSHDMLVDVLKFGKIGYWELYIDSAKLTLSDEVYTIIGRDHVINKLSDLNEIIMMDDLKSCIKKIQNDMREKRFSENEIHIKRKDGTDFWVYSKIKVTERAQGKIKRVLGIVQDISQEKRSEYELIKAKEKAEESSRAKGLFLANMSHEIRTPISGIIGFLELLEKNIKENRLQVFVREAKKSSSLLLNIINDILDLSKIEAGKIGIKEESFDLVSNIEDIAVLLTPLAIEKNLDLNVIIDPEINENVIGDAGRLKQVFNNLVGNAIKFTQKGSVTIKAIVKNKSVEKIDIAFSVIDTGIGISTEDQKKIFEIFEQVQNTPHIHQGGTGLGLSISKKIIHNMGSSFEVKSFPGEGSTFSFILTFKRDKSTSYVVDTSNIRGKKIFIVDNNKDTHAVIENYLSLVDCEIHKAMNAEEAMEILTSGYDAFDVMIIDYLLPDATALELATSIREIETIKPLPMILLVYIGRDVDTRSIQNAGFLHTITRPVRKRELLTTLNICTSKDEAKPSSEIKAEPITVTDTSKRKKILLVEDNEINQTLMKEIFSMTDYEIDIAINGIEAVELYKTARYNLILMDCQLPLMDGYEATRQIRKLELEDQHISIIGYSASISEEEKDSCLDAGMDHFISKPVNINKLLTLIEKYTGLSVRKTSSITPLEETVESNFADIVKTIHQEFGMPESIAEKLLRKFFDRLPDIIKELEMLCQKKDYESLRLKAHSLKGSSANLALVKLSDIAARLEELAAQEISEECVPLIKELKTICTKHYSFSGIA